MSKIKEALHYQQQIEQEYYVKFMEFVCDQILEDPKKVEEENSEESSNCTSKILPSNALKPANNEKYFNPLKGA
jgi:hypothetical protein